MTDTFERGGTIAEVSAAGPPEELDSRGFTTGVEAEVGGPADVHAPFDPDQIEVQTRVLTVSSMLARLRGGELDLRSELTRPGIWSATAKSRLIESLLLRLPLPSLYAAELENGTWVVVDGIQRLTTVAEFIEPGLVDAGPLRLRDLEYLDRECGDMTFAELPGRLQTRLRETELLLHLVRTGTPDAVMFNIFARLNTGGLPLSAQELRHALIPGKAASVLRDWAESPTFLQATSTSIRTERMADRELILRFIAFRMTRARTIYQRRLRAIPARRDAPVEHH